MLYKAKIGYTDSLTGNINGRSNTEAGGSIFSELENFTQVVDPTNTVLKMKNMEIKPKPPTNSAKAWVCFLPIALAIGVKRNAKGMANRLYNPNKCPVRFPALLNASEWVSSGAKPKW